jgi:hypothetical protein
VQIEERAHLLMVAWLGDDLLEVDGRQQIRWSCSGARRSFVNEITSKCSELYTNWRTKEEKLQGIQVVEHALPPRGGHPGRRACSCPWPPPLLRIQHLNSNSTER